MQPTVSWKKNFKLSINRTVKSIWEMVGNKSRWIVGKGSPHDIPPLEVHRNSQTKTTKRADPGFLT
jgi:hypothetical protein